jgi:zinc transport system substrate-binding protein
MKNYFVVFLMFILFSGCLIETSLEEEKEKKINVVVSFYPLYEFTSNVGGDKVSVEMLIPPNVEPHEYELKPSDMIKILESDLFIYNGAGMEPWVHNIIEYNEIYVLDASKGVKLLENECNHEHETHHHQEEEHGTHHHHEEENETHHHYEEEHGHEHGEYDPHIWLSPLNAIKQVENIRDKLIELDENNEEYYTENANEYIMRLSELDEKIKEEINPEKCKKRDVVITHATLGYFCAEYNCNQIALSGITPEAEMSIKQITEIMHEIEGKNVTVIFFEEQVNPKTAEVIADELGIETMIFNTIHGITEEEKKAGKNYITLMEENISKLKYALECGFD